jgi:hypothetical protein
MISQAALVLAVVSPSAKPGNGFIPVNAAALSAVFRSIFSSFLQRGLVYPQLHTPVYDVMKSGQ